MTGYLFDENLPSRLSFTPSLPVTHSTALGPSLSDSSIWNYARDHALAVVTRDSDFSERILLSVPPPWIVLLRFGNMCRGKFHPLLARIWPQIEALLPEHKLLIEYEDRIETARD